jgi:putative transcriptional regulator
MMLAAFAAGVTDLGERVAIATHLASCARCRDWVRAMECVGGETLAALAPTPIGDGALARTLARLDKPDAGATGPLPLPSAGAIPGLPEFVRRYRFGEWRWVAPSVSLRPIRLPEASETRVFLLKSGPGTTMLQHSHSGVELTCVLQGAFTHEGGRYGPGDFDIGDETIDHRPIVDAAQDCVCLVAMRGKLRLEGLIGRIMQPFLRI